MNDHKLRRIYLQDPSFESKYRRMPLLPIGSNAYSPTSNKYMAVR